MTKKVPFSGKQKKKQLQEKRNRKKGEPAKDEEIKTYRYPLRKPTKIDGIDVELIQALPGHLRSRFVAEPRELVQQRIKFAQTPISEGLPTKEDEKELLVLHEENSKATVSSASVSSRIIPWPYSRSIYIDLPRRPSWSSAEETEELEKREEKIFHAYLKNIYERFQGIPLNNFEHSLDVWRQFWRVGEISNVIAVLCDARWPLLHLPFSLTSYIIKHLKLPFIIVITKVDLVPISHVSRWRDYLQNLYPNTPIVTYSDRVIGAEGSYIDVMKKYEQRKVRHKRTKRKRAKPIGFYGILQGLEQLGFVGPSGVDPEFVQKIKLKEEQLIEATKTCNQNAAEEEGDDDDDSSEDSEEEELLEECDEEDENEDGEQEVDGEDNKSPRKEELDEETMAAKDREETEDTDNNESDVLQTNETIDKDSWPQCAEKNAPKVVYIGLMGHPNVGKSSLLNGLVGKKVQSTSRTPGHTKHLQTYYITNTLVVVDGPGIVMPAILSSHSSGNADSTVKPDGDDLHKVTNQCNKTSASGETFHPETEISTKKDRNRKKCQIMESRSNYEESNQVDSENSKWERFWDEDQNNKRRKKPQSRIEAGNVAIPVSSNNRGKGVIPTPSAFTAATVIESANGRALQTLAGLYPLGRLREPYTAVGLIAKRVALDDWYGLSPEETIDEVDFSKGSCLKTRVAWSSFGLCEAYAVKRGYRTPKGRPDAHRAGLAIVRDCIDGLVPFWFDIPLVSLSNTHTASSNECGTRDTRGHLAGFESLEEFDPNPKETEIGLNPIETEVDQSDSQLDTRGNSSSICGPQEYDKKDGNKGNKGQQRMRKLKQKSKTLAHQKKRR